LLSDNVIGKYIDSAGIVFQYSVIPSEKILFICGIGGFGGDVFLPAADIIFHLLVFRGIDFGSECIKCGGVTERDSLILVFS
jgi:hypothetical protein